MQAGACQGTSVEFVFTLVTKAVTDFVAKQAQCEPPPTAVPADSGARGSDSGGPSTGGADQDAPMGG
eukprot:2558863-Pyramimonas_sp.AAC.1